MWTSSPDEPPDGDCDALTALVQEPRHLTCRLALRFVGHLDDAKDATQESLIRIVTRLGNFERRSKFTTWAYTVGLRRLLGTRQRLVESSAGHTSLRQRDRPRLRRGSRDSRVRPCGVPPAALADAAPPGYVIDNRCGVIDPPNSCRCWRHSDSSEQAGILGRRHLPLRRHARCVVRVGIEPAAKRLDTLVAIGARYDFDRGAGPAQLWDGAAAMVPRTPAFVLMASMLREEPASGSRWRLQRARPSGAAGTSPVTRTPVTIARRHGFEHVSIRRIHPGAQTLDIHVDGRPSAASWCTSSTPPAEGITSPSTKAGLRGRHPRQARHRRRRQRHRPACALHRPAGLYRGPRRAASARRGTPRVLGGVPDRRRARCLHTLGQARRTRASSSSISGRASSWAPPSPGRECRSCRTRQPS
jgi:hypothetical protein